MNGLAKTCWIAAPVFALIGMVLGIYMAASQDHTLAPAHAHLNLLGWVSVAIYGAFYTLVPRSAVGTLAKLQVLLAIAGAVVLVPGIAIAVTGGGEGLAQAGSLIAIVSMLLFLIVVLREAMQPSTGQPAG